MRGAKIRFGVCLSFSVFYCFWLIQGALGAGKITGKVYDDLGRGIYEIGVFANKSGSSTAWYYYSTDGNGNFVFDPVEAGTYSLSLRDPFHYRIRIFTDVLVTDGETVRVNIPLHSTYIVYDDVWDVAWHAVYGQTFKATGSCIVKVTGRVASPAATINVSIYDSPSKTTQIGPTRSFYAGTSGRGTASWYAGEVPTTPGITYYVELTKQGGGTWSSYLATSGGVPADTYPYGTAYYDGTPQSFDLGLIIQSDDDRFSTAYQVRDSNYGYWANEIGQTFVATCENITYACATIGTGSPSYFDVDFAILSGGPGGAQIGPIKTAIIYKDGTGAVSWLPSEVPVTKGGTYYLKITRHGATPGLYIYMRNDNPYPSGQVYVNGSGAGWGNYDIKTTIMGEDTTGSSKGTYTGIVTNSLGTPLQNAKVTTNLGGYYALTNADGSYSLSVTAETYDLTASKAGYLSASQTNQEVEPGGRKTVNFSLTAMTAELVIRSISTSYANVYRGDTSVLVSMVVENVGTLDAFFTSATLKFRKNSTDVSSEYTVSPETSNPTWVKAGMQMTLNFKVDVSSSVTLGNIVLDGEIIGWKNLVVNGTFEYDANIPPYHWENWNQAGSYSLDTTTYVSATQSYRFSLVSAPNGAWITSSTGTGDNLIPVSANTEYQIGVSMKDSTTSGSMSRALVFEQYDASKTKIGSDQYLYMPATATWTAYYFRQTTLSNAAYSRIWVGNQTGSAGTTAECWWDEVYMKKVGEEIADYDSDTTASWTVNASAPSPAWTFATGAAVRSLPTVRSGRLYVGSDDGHLYAIDATSGAQKWKYPEIGNIGQIRSGVIALPGTGIETGKYIIYFACEDGYLYSLRDDGTSVFERWKTSLGAGIVSTCTPAPYPLPHGDYLYVAGMDKRIHKLDSSNGTEVALSDVLEDVIASSLSTQSDAVFLGVGASGALSGKVYRLTNEDLRVHSSFSTGKRVSVSLFLDGYNGTLYFGSEEGVFYALNASNLVEQKWRYPSSSTLGSAIKTWPFVNLSTQVVCFGCEDGKLYALDAATGALKAGFPFPTEGALGGAVVIYNEVAYFGSADSYVYAVNISDGTLRWRAKTDGPVSSAPTIDGTYLYIGSDDYKVYCFRL